jgi:hypothetical protein
MRPFIISEWEQRLSKMTRWGHLGRRVLRAASARRLQFSGAALHDSFRGCVSADSSQSHRGSLERVESPEMNTSTGFNISFMGGIGTRHFFSQIIV